MSKHTPGPWKLVPSQESEPTWPSIEVAPHRIITVEGRDCYEAEANVYLIAAAPEMYEALRALVEHVQPGALKAEGIARAPRQRDIDAARAALAKAEGKS